MRCGATPWMSLPSFPEYEYSACMMFRIEKPRLVSWISPDACCNAMRCSSSGTSLSRRSRSAEAAGALGDVGREERRAGTGRRAGAAPPERIGGGLTGDPKDEREEEQRCVRDGWLRGDTSLSTFPQAGTRTRVRAVRGKPGTTHPPRARDRTQDSPQQRNKRTCQARPPLLHLIDGGVCNGRDEPPARPLSRVGRSRRARLASPRAASRRGGCGLRAVAFAACGRVGARAVRIKVPWRRPRATR